MNFAQPYWLLGGLAACLLLIWRFRRFNRQQHAALRQFVSPRLAKKLTGTVSPGRRRIKQALVVVGAACVFAAMARPRLGYRWEEAHRKGIELLVAIDTSKSMLTRDVKPDRLDRAKLAVDDLVDRLDGDSVGLLAFAGDSFLQCPITQDYDALRQSLDSIDTNTIPRGGTDIGGAIRESQAVLNARPAGDKILVLMTDGEDLNGDAIAAAEAAGKSGIKIFTVGVGTSAGELIPVADASGGTSFVKDDAGNFIKSHLDEAALKQIAQATGGMYQPLGQQGQGLLTIYNQGLAPFTRHDLATRQSKVYIERYQWPLLAGLLGFAGELLISTRRRREPVAAIDRGVVSEQPMSKPVLRAPVKVAAVAVVAIVMLPAVSHASPGTAESAYQKGNFSQAEADYAASLAKQPQQSQLQFNLGSAAYKSGDYAKAKAAFENTLKATDVPLQQSAYYNLGNTEFRLGQKTEKAKPDDTIKTWQQALQSYESALQIKPDDADAKFNRDLVKRKLDELQKQQQQKQDQQKQDQKQDNKDQKDQQNSGQSQNQNQANNGESKQDQNHQGQGKDQQAENQPPKDQQDQKNPQPNLSSAQNRSPSDQKNAAQPDQQKKDANQQQAQSGQPQSPKPDDQKASAGQGQKPQDQPSQASDTERSQPGEMTKEEAKQLLDSQKGDEHSLQPAQAARGPVTSQNDQPLKDW